MAFFIGKLVAVAHRYSVLLVESRDYGRAVSQLQLVITMLQNERPHHLTQLHADFLLVCMKARQYQAAAQALAHPIFEIDPQGSGVKPIDNLLYHYYGGMVFAALKRFEEALEFFEMVLTAPSQLLSAIQIESYKKYILVSLILHGKALDLPKHCSRVVAQYVARVCQPYVALQTAFGQGSQSLERTVSEHAHIFVADKNFGLVKQVATALVRHTILRMTHTYLTLPFSVIARDAALNSPQQAKEYVLDMIENGQIFALIDESEGTVKFLENPEEYDSKEMIQALDAKIQQAESIVEKIHAIDQDIQLNPRFIAKTLKSAQGSGQFNPMMEESFGTAI
eukprot:TRINITY_DN10605_c0_g1_i2.p1 TRINITY_DN10605_c0_g1~~TRINITY_DN10605_c0_g1_i2.p1  ORF type:complete len:338 (+),score=126.42 TRINITY_DN10605_c0_g1_i2:46-1059(+)